jgi:DeoR family glycerol-3-phosphate regulon repressor
MVLADHLKFKRTAPLKICSLKDVAKLFTDVALPSNLLGECNQWGTDVVVA